MRIRQWEKGSRLGRCGGAVLLAAGLALAGCSAPDDSGTGTAEIGTGSAINPHARDDIKDGGNLRLATTAYPENWNTLQIDGNNNEIAEIVWPMMPRAYSTDAAGNLSVNHDYFTDVQLTGTNPQQVTYTINPKAVWTDGSPITWEDMRQQWLALNGSDKTFLIAQTNGFDRVSAVERGADDRQAVFTFSRPYADWRGQFSGNSMLYPKSVTATPEAFNTSQVEAIGLTAGPFLVQSTDRTQGRIVLGHNPKWWGEKPKLDTITISVLDRLAWPQALQNKELDAAILSTIDDLATVRSTPGMEIRTAPGNRWRHFTFNGAPGSIVADPAVRVAIMKAIDRQQIADVIQNGLVAKPEPLNNHVFLRGQTGYQDNAFAFDPDAANRELDALGWVR